MEHRTRYQLVEEARRLGVEKPERLTRVELRDEIIRRGAPASEQMDARGLFGVARSMLASVVEAGLKLPDAAKVIRGDHSLEVPLRSRSPVATVTLAEIYAAQGHRERAVAMLAEVLAQEPDHEEAARILAQLSGDAPLTMPSEASPSGAQEREEQEAESPGPGEEMALRGSAPPSPSPSPSLSASPSPSENPDGPPSGPSTEYAPPTFVETSGEDIVTGQPPEVIPEEASPSLVIEQRDHELLLYFELPSKSLDPLCAQDPGGRPAIRIVSFSPAQDHPARRDRSVDLSIEASGSLRLAGFLPGDAIRAALGWMSGDAFVPLSVGCSLAELGAPEAGTIAFRAEAAFASLP